MTARHVGFQRVTLTLVAAFLSFGLPVSSATSAPLVPPIGTITDFKIPTANGQPSEIAFGPDGSLWFTEFGGNKIGRITPKGVITEFPLPAAATPDHIAAGPDGNLRVTDSNDNQVAR